MLRFGLKAIPRIGYNQAMHRAVLTLLVGLTLSFSDGATALTFGKDGKVVGEGLPDSATPEAFLAEAPITNVLKMRFQGSTEGYYDRSWSLCSATSHNLAFIIKNCSPAQDKRRQIISHLQNDQLTRFACWHQGKAIHSSNRRNIHNWAHGKLFEKTFDCADENIDQTLWMASQLTEVTSNPDYIVPKPTKLVSKIRPAMPTSSPSTNSVASTSQITTSSSAATGQNSDAGPPLFLS